MESLLISAMKSEPVPVTCYLSQILYLQRVVTGSSVGCFTASPHTAEDLPNTVRCSGQKYHCILLKLSPTRFVRPDSMQLIANAPVPWLSGICVSRAQTGNVFADTMISRFTNPLFSCRVPGIFIVMPWWWFNLALFWFWNSSLLRSGDLAQNSRAARLSPLESSREATSGSIRNTQREALRGWWTDVHHPAFCVPIRKGRSLNVNWSGNAGGAVRINPSGDTLWNVDFTQRHGIAHACALLPFPCFRPERGTSYSSLACPFFPPG